MRALARLKAKEETESHGVVEWDEPGNPCNVVQKKYLHEYSSDNVEPQKFAVGELCKVQVCEGAKMVTYKAKLLGSECGVTDLS
jgi:protease II